MFVLQPRFQLRQSSSAVYHRALFSALAVSDERGRTARFPVIKVRSHHAAPTPTSLADGLLADRIQAGRSCLLKCFKAAYLALGVRSGGNSAPEKISILHVSKST